VLALPVVQQPDGESVLIQGRSAGQTYASDPEIRQAVRQVVAALRALPHAAASIESPLTTKGLVSGRSALVTFNVAGKPGNDDQAVVPALNAVAAVQARHPGLTVEEAGGASLDRATGSITSQDFRKAEVTSVPVSLVLLLIVFGALIAAGIPLLLAGTAVISAISLMAIPSRWLPVGRPAGSRDGVGLRGDSLVDGQRTAAGDERVVADQGHRGVHVVSLQDRITAHMTVRVAGAHAVRGDGDRRPERGARIGQGAAHLADPGAEVGHGLLAGLLALGHPAAVVGDQESWHHCSPSSSVPGPSVAQAITQRLCPAGRMTCPHVREGPG
jgi:hypothetical protein